MDEKDELVRRNKRNFKQCNESKEDNTIKYIDFDFDVKIYPGKPFQIVDHYDFERNKIKWYNSDIIDVIYQNLIEIAKKYQNREDIFDEYYVYQIFESLIMMKEIDKKNFNHTDD